MMAVVRALAQLCNLLPLACWCTHSWSLPLLSPRCSVSPFGWLAFAVFVLSLPNVSCANWPRDSLAVPETSPLQLPVGRCFPIMSWYWEWGVLLVFSLFLLSDYFPSVEHPPESHHGLVKSSVSAWSLALAFRPLWACT